MLSVGLGLSICSSNHLRDVFQHDCLGGLRHCSIKASQPPLEQQSIAVQCAMSLHDGHASNILTCLDSVRRIRDIHVPSHAAVHASAHPAINQEIWYESLV